MKKNERLQIELEDADVRFNAAVAGMRHLCALVLEGDPKARDVARDVLVGNLESANLREIRAANGELVLDGDHWSVMVLARSLGGLLTKPDGTFWNNIEVRFDCGAEPRVVVTVQRVGGKTPLEQRAEALARAGELEAEVAILRGSGSP